MDQNKTAIKNEKSEPMTFKEALKILDIEDYANRIYNSNSHGELYHIQQYFHLAKFDYKDIGICFRTEFEEIVKYAEENWNRPESVFQHILDCLHSK